MENEDKKVSFEKRKQQRQEKIRQRKNKERKNTITGYIFVVIVVLTFVICLGPHLYYNSQAIYVNDKHIATINGTAVSQNQFNDLLVAKLRERAGNNIQINETVELKKIHTPKKEIAVNTDVIITNICNQLTYKGEGGVIKVNGEEVVVLASKEEAENVINAALDKYKPEGSNVIEVSFIDTVVAESKFVEEDELSTPEAAIKLLTATKRMQTTYIVQAGDAFSSIAEKNRMTVDEMLNLNPDITKETMTRLKIGQLLNVMADIPVYPVKTVLSETTTEALTMSAVIKTDDSKYKTYQYVTENGQAGQCIKTHRVTYINGKESYRRCVDTAVIKAPVDKQVVLGTQEEPTYYAQCSFSYPIKGCYISSGFGTRDYGSGVHYGTDFAAPTGTEIYATDSGIVEKAGSSGNGYGTWVVINHKNGFKSLYAHCSSVCVKPGENVKKGQHIANVGNTGDSTGSHLHFEIINNGEKNDPMDYLA